MHDIDWWSILDIWSFPIAAILVWVGFEAYWRWERVSDRTKQKLFLLVFTSCVILGFVKLFIKIWQ